MLNPSLRGKDNIHIRDILPISIYPLFISVIHTPIDIILDTYLDILLIPPRERYYLHKDIQIILEVKL